MWRRKLGYEEANDSLQIGQMRNLIRNVPRPHVTASACVAMERSDGGQMANLGGADMESRSHPAFGYEMPSIDFLALFSFYIPVTMFV